MENEKCFVDFDLNCSAGPVGGVGVPQLLEVELLMRNLLNLTFLANLIVPSVMVICMVIGKLLGQKAGIAKYS